ncbi:MAG: hypothetical protein D3926_14220 [Desulfobacteraceae bacterium]|nr:MAG: hypothetical protein D3926_14220 [Desulfobacteraceae bacterium]
MGTCINHPDRETNTICMKHGIYQCGECMACRDPDMYCKFRPACLIHFNSKKGFDEATIDNCEKKKPLGGQRIIGNGHLPNSPKKEINHVAITE